MYEERRSPAIWVAVVLSTLLHLGGMFGASSIKPAVVAAGEELIQVSVYDITRRPEVAKVLPKQELGGGGPGPADASAMSYTPSGATDGPTIDLQAALDRGPSQAKIDLDRYELDRSAGGMDVVYLGGKGGSQSTDEILSQPSIALTRAPGGGGGGSGRGIPGIPQAQAQLSIEHKPLAKPVARSLPELPSVPTQTIAAAPKTGSSFMIAGPISQREVVTKVKPRYPRWALQQRVSGTVTVRIWVLPGGSVKGAPQVTCSSGYPDLDQVVTEALKLWEFAPLGPNVKSEDQWGDVTFVFQLS